jgi:hypothetical protein
MPGFRNFVIVRPWTMVLGIVLLLISAALFDQALAPILRPVSSWSNLVLATAVSMAIALFAVIAMHLFSGRRFRIPGAAVLATLGMMALSMGLSGSAKAATDDQYLNAIRGLGSRLTSVQMVPITMVAGATTQATITVPYGSWIRAIKAETGTAFTGSPTNINLTAGSTAAGTDIMAATDIKAAGHFTGTIVAAFDVTNAAATAAYTVNLQIAAVGGTTPAGTVYVYVDYAAPVH